MDISFLQKTLPYWDKITDAERKDILENIVTVKYSAGERIHNADDDCIGMFIVKKGELRTYLLSDRGKEFTLFRLEAGGVCVLAASCLLKNITFDVFIDAEQDCELLLINSIVLSRLHAQNPLIENFALKVAADKFSDVIRVMEKMLFMTFERRLTTFLLAECEKNNSMDIPLTHEQIAVYIGSAREVVSRTIKQFEKEGIVHLSRGGVKIINKEALKAMSEKEE